MNQTDTRPSHLPSTTPPKTAEPAEKEPLLGLSAAQVAGSAAAAATAAALGSRLGVVGTVVGAALISAITAVAGAFYTQSLRRTRAAMARTAERMPTMTLRVPSQGADIEVTGGLPEVPDQPEGTEQDVAHTATQTAPVTRDDGADSEPPWWRRLTWKTTAVTAAVVFALAAVLVTGLELVTDRSLDGTGRTSVGHLFGDDSSGSSGQQTETPSPSPSDGSTSGSTGDATSTPTTSETPSASASPGGDETPTDGPTATPTDGTGTTEPTGSATAVPTTD